MKINISAFAFLCVALTGCSVSKQAVKTTATLEGTWQLNYITEPRIAFDGLYPDKKPTIAFDVNNHRVYGNNSCNQYFGALHIDGNKINFPDAKMGMTMMACPGAGENVFMGTLEKINSYSISDDGKTLNLAMGDIIMMRLEKLRIDAHNSQNALDWQGTYKGITPCADCEGIETEIVLNTDLTFVFKTKYLGKGEGKVIEEKGKFRWDQRGGSISLLGLKGVPFQYKVGENKMIQLDMHGNPIAGELADKYVLTKE